MMGLVANPNVPLSIDPRYQFLKTPPSRVAIAGSAENVIASIPSTPIPLPEIFVAAYAVMALGEVARFPEPVRPKYTEGMLGLTLDHESVWNPPGEDED